MRLHSFVALTLAAAIAAPSQAAAPGPSDTASSVVSIVLLVPFSVVYLSAKAVAEGASATVDVSQRWSVGAVRPDGDKTALELHSDDKQLKIDMAIQTRIAQKEALKVGDRIDIEAIGKAGYVVKKGKATVALLAEPGSGMVHSRPRS
ncbi:hypothetical protein RCH14_002810 [Massilia sp. MP_M2]|uniref:hypothetical protein n=1 Tax=Massilia sp. MP_M2 TaxID=3071713 RepID=UPI00319E1303